MGLWIADRAHGDYEANPYFVIDCLRQSIKVISVFTYSGAQFFPRTPDNFSIIGAGLLGRMVAGIIGVLNASGNYQPMKRGKDFPIIFP